MNVLLPVLKISVAIVCFMVGLLMGILEMLFFDKRRHAEPAPVVNGYDHNLDS